MLQIELLDFQCKEKNFETKFDIMIVNINFN